MSNFVHCRVLVMLAVAFLAGCRRAELATSAVSVAAASNFVYALDALNDEFKRREPGVTITATIGSSGGLFAQIRNGAPFDAFLSADTEYPTQVVASNLGEKSTLRVFATGRMVAWTLREDVDLSSVAAAIRSAPVRRVAMAQPRSAPYGRAAQAAMESAGVWREAEPKLVLGENISQTAQFIETGNAEVGLVALSLVLSPKLRSRGRWVEIPTDAYKAVSLDHAAVLTQRGAANPAARRYLEFLESEPAKKILRDFGYGVP